MTELDYLAEEIYKRYGSVKRARGSFLYTAKQQRLTDMFRENGRAILGWGGSSAFTQFKNVLNRGLTGGFVSDFTNRPQKAISDLLGTQRKVYLFADKKSAMEAALNVCSESTSVFKPWSQVNVDWKTVDAVIVAPPLPWISGITAVAFNHTVDIEIKLSHCEEKFKTARFPAPVEAASARAVYNLIKALQEMSEKDWFVYDKVLTRYWRREGPYLYIKTDVVSREKFPSFLEHCLDCGVIINPVYEGCSIVPFGANPGVFSKLSKAPWIPSDK